MRCSCSKLLLLSPILVLVYIAIYRSFDKSEVKQLKQQNKNAVSIVAVCCGESRIAEVTTMVKSALVFSTNSYPLRIVLVAEKPLFDLLTLKMESFQKFYNFTFLLKEISFPEENAETWRKLFKPCASQRLFLPSVLWPDVDGSIIYVDSDLIFLSPPQDIFQMLRRFNSTQLAGLAPESESKNTGWYTRFARHPFYGPHGVNSGVMLMNLTRMREVEWELKLLPIYDQYNLNLVFGDQDIINIYFFFHPDELFVLPCEYNYRPDHCMYGVKSCQTADDGIKIIHGNRGYFHKPENQPIFSQIFLAFQKVRKLVNEFSWCLNLIFF